VPAPLVLDGLSLDLDAAISVARRRVPVAIAPAARERLRAARAFVDRIVEEDHVVYGISTGFGKLAHTRIAREDLRRLQRNLIVSHAVGTGVPASAPVVRMMMLLRLNALLRGHSGVREETADLLAALLNEDVLPVVPEQGSVGASGDLAPLSHLALVLLGEGEALFDGERLPGGEALFRAGLSPVRLEAKEGLALINGTPFTCAVGALAMAEARELCVVADVACGMTLEGLLGSVTPFDPRIARLRAHRGHAETSANLRRIMEGSEIVESHRDCGKVQDQYSVRCVPQVHGAVRDALRHVLATVAIELNAVTDNPLLFPDDGAALSGGNFHAEPLALPFDYAKCAVAELASISERRIETMVNPDLSGLPAFLAGGDVGVNSGLMIAQVTAAALVSENKVLAHPASVDSIPTSANKEDHVSMGPIAARHLRDVCANTAGVLAIELLCARFAMHHRKPLRGGLGAEAAFKHLAARIKPPGEDRWFARDIDAARAAIDDGSLLAAVEAATGPLARPVAVSAVSS
jgi:histidine ammonia-lyase